MKPLRQLCIALTVTLTLAVTPFAGEIHTTVAPPPVSIAATESQIDTTVAGQKEIGSGETTAASSATEIALSLLQSMLALF